MSDGREATGATVVVRPDPAGEPGSDAVEVPPALGRAIRRMFPTLARAAVAVCRLHRRTRRVPAPDASGGQS
jgi:hypothetical protein